MSDKMVKKNMAYIESQISLVPLKVRPRRPRSQEGDLPGNPEMVLWRKRGDLCLGTGDAW